MWQRLLLINICILGYGTVQAQWTLEKEENGIKVYTADLGTSPVKSVKVEATLKGTCRKLISLFQAVEKQPQWVYAARQAYLIKRISDNELLYYVEMALPWPAKNRDAAVQMTIEGDPSDGKLEILTIGEPDAIAAKSGKIRVPEFKGIWEVTEVNNGQIKIVYTLSLDPGGSLPARIVNLFVAKGPYETFISLARLLEN